MDYESEEGEGGEEEEEEEEEEGVEREEQEGEQSPQEEDASLDPAPAEVEGGTGAGNAAGREPVNSEMDMMRVNAVLESSTSIEEYSYDTQDELWCEVGQFVRLSVSV